MNWIDKNKKLPPIGEFEDISIYVHVTNGELIGYGNYNYDSKKWTYQFTGRTEQDDNEITYWMPLIKLPSENKVYIEYDLDELLKIAEILSGVDDKHAGHDSWKSDEFIKFCETIENCTNDAVGIPIL